MSSILQTINNAAQAVVPSMFQQKMEPAPSPSMRGKMIPSAPPQPSEEDLNKHYLSRDKTLENVAGAVQSSLNYCKEVAAEVSQSLPSAEDLKTKIPSAIGLGPKLDENGVPVPPPLPSKEDLHKHYLIPLAPPLPTKEMMHKHYLIPLAPPLPTKEDLNKHYLSRDKTLENASNILRSAANMMSNFASDIKANLPSTADLGLSKRLDANGIPIPPPLPTKEMMHKHYLIPMAPPLPSKEDLHGHYLIPMAPPLPGNEDLNKHYLSRDRTLENVQNTAKSYLNTASEYAEDLKDAVVHVPVFATSRSVPAPPPLPTKEMMHKHYLSRPLSQNERAIVENLYTPAQDVSTASPLFSFNKVRRLANNAASTIMSKVYTPSESLSSQGAIPVPPPLPTNEMMHKHYLIPLAPPLPTKEDLNKHYMARDKTIEKAGSALSHALTFISEVATEVKDYVMETPIDQMKLDAKEVINPTPLDSQGIPIPPPLPTREMMNKHYLIPLAPPLPTRENLHRHYLSRDKTLENAGNSILSAVHLAEEIAKDAKDAVVDGTIAAKDAVVDGTIAAKDALVENAAAAKDIVVDSAENAGDFAAAKVADASQGISNAVSTVADGAVAAKDAVVDGAVQLKEKVLPTPQKEATGLKFPRSEVISESPIFKKKPAGARRITPRHDYNGFKPLIHGSAQRI